MTRPETRRRGGDDPRGPVDPYRPAYDLIRLRVEDRPLAARRDPLHGPSARRPMTFAARGGKQAGPLRRFVRAYGWRAYAIPLLTVATFLAVLDLTRSGAPAGSGPAAKPGAQAPAGPVVPKAKSGNIYVDSPAAGELGAKQLPATALPPGGPYSLQGGGRFDVVPGSSKVYGSGPLQRYTVEVEAGVAESGPDFAVAVERTLGDPRSWGHGGAMSFQRVDGGQVDFRVTLTAALTVRKLCGYTLPFETSCYNGAQGRAVINDARWVRGAVAFPRALASYRAYVINHEVGHALGHDHEPCRRQGGLAPVMMQQTLGLTTAGVGSCRANPWPHP